ncbi:hypothetical protein [Pseudoalteromonas sp. SWXJZ10B]|uniref:hypothetical protein n=1 Tax=Pseudoalteromonas sp. SWXJZ10B TaxID=2792063 RepID=UPI0018CD6D60|nr:hypothetical protein [Pseudoalteromonas sp. SWXJZ10B]MBH0043141.1 hypothetical protein [Pseudoalteromonas sp. SWXJZ10B]
MYDLNDLWRAFIAPHDLKGNKRPSEWRNKQRDELNITDDVMVTKYVVSKERVNWTTLGTKKGLLCYAAWLNSDLLMAVVEAFDKMNIESVPSQSAGQLVDAARANLEELDELITSKTHYTFKAPHTPDITIEDKQIYEDSIHFSAVIRAALAILDGQVCSYSFDEFHGLLEQAA